jgi:Na+/proline symporter
LLGGTFISLFLIVTQLDGGFLELTQSAWDQGKFDMLDWDGDYTSTAVWVVVFGTMVTTLVGYTSDQTVIQRYLTTASVKEAANALWLNALITPISGLMFFGLGTALFLFYQSHPALLRPELQTDAVLPLFIVQQLPLGVSGLVIAALFAAAMSSLDSSMNSISATVVTDLKDRMKFFQTEERRLSLARWVTIVAGIVGTASAVLLATFQIKSVWDMIFILTGLLSGGLGGIFILGIFTTRARSLGVLLGLICSATVMIVVQFYTNIHFFLFTSIGVVVCVVIGYLSSLILGHTKEIDLDGLTVYSVYAESKE